MRGTPMLRMELAFVAVIKKQKTSDVSIPRKL